MTNLMKASKSFGRYHYIAKLRANPKYKSFSLYSMLSKHFTYAVDDGVAVITFDTPNSKVNSFSLEVQNEFEGIYKTFNEDNSASSAVVISGKPDCFVAGADINMLEKITKIEDAKKISMDGQKLTFDIEKNPKPIVAAIMGSCLGGGLELAMACHYRIAVNDKKTTLGLPEVLLGLLPGSGGTQRLPRLVSVPNALDMMLTGRNIRPDKAKKMGLVDQIIQPLGPGIDSPSVNTRNYLEKVAKETARNLVSKRLKKEQRKKGLMENMTEKLLQYDFGRNFVLNQAKSKVMKTTFGNYPAPLRILEVVEETLKNGMDKGYEAESQKFAELVMTKESNALIGLFHGRNHCKKNHFDQTPDIKKVGVLGAGLMGAGITQVTMDKGYKTVLKDVSDASLAKGVQYIEKNLELSQKKKKISSAEKIKLLSKLKPTTEYSQFRDVDVVIEAVFEDLNLKHKVIQETEKYIPEQCIFATNTSALPIKGIAKGSARPQNVVGMHYFSPVEKMELLEIITHDTTSQRATAAAVELGLRQGKTIITVGDGPGFYTTRILAFMMSELLRLFLEGVSPKKIDNLSKKFGWPVGTATLVDEVGVDVATHIAKFLSNEYGSRYTDIPTSFFDQMVAGGNLGRKSGKGIFVYEKNSKNKPENPEALSILAQFKIEPKLELTDESIQWRLASRFINEAVLCLEEGILKSPLEGDIGAVFGLGFPPFLGGPFRYIDNYGAQSLVEKMEKYRDAYGDSFKPCNLLYEHSKDATKKFHKSA